MTAQLRAATARDRRFLATMVALAVDWRPGTEPRGADAVLADPELVRYVGGWPQPGERGLVAQVADEPVGAAWWRGFPADDPAYGFVAADVPEVSVAVAAAHRGRGIGSRLLDALIRSAQEQDLPGLSLSVEPDNPAQRLYRRLGFTPVGGVGGSVTMLLALRR